MENSSPDSYSVDTGVLREVAGNLGGQASSAQSLVNRAGTTDVPAGSWGTLGYSLGLPDLYTQVRDQADSTLNRIHDFLLWSSQTLSRTAADYDNQEASTVRHFRAIGGGNPTSGGTT
ncbi:hypothetical protein SAMN05444157_3340 [Frankineae bacterium MT45]|nr:hypothetical protein SAMN05444157_3340 [Frankineae bacterium MT45]